MQLLYQDALKRGLTRWDFVEEQKATVAKIREELYGKEIKEYISNSRLYHTHPFKKCGDYEKDTYHARLVHPPKVPSMEEIIRGHRGRINR